MIQGPFLTARADGATPRILDPLGLDATGASMVRQFLFPGMTGGLRHVRYFSFLTWIAGSFSEQGAGRKWASYSRRLEHALRIGALHNQPGMKSIIGRDSTPTLAELSRSALVDLDKTLPSAYEAQYYGPSFTALGFGKRTATGAPQLSAQGRKLFAALEVGLNQAEMPVQRAVRRLKGGPADMRVSELLELASFFRLERVRPGNPEFESLKDALMGAQGVTPENRGAREGRTRSLALVLEVVSNDSLSITGWPDLLAILRSSQVGRAIQERHQHELLIWRCFGERQEQRIAFGAFWKVILDWMRAASPIGVSPHALVARATDLLPSPASLETPTATMEWGSYEDIVAQRAGDTSPRRMAYRLNLASRVAGQGSDAPTAQERTCLGLELVAACVASWRIDGRGADDASVAVHSHGGVTRMTLPWFVEQLDAKRSEPVAAVLGWLMERCVLDQVQRVGYAKGPGISKVLLIREQDEVRFAREAPRNDPFAQDVNRLQAALAMLEGLSMIRRTEGRYVITSTGTATLRKLAFM